MVFSAPPHSDLKALNILIHDDLQKDISSLETLAQMALVCIVIQHLPGCRIPLKIATQRQVSNKLFSTRMPLALFLERLYQF